ncbi:MAG: hypothetical protein KGZ88_21960 [Methylomicrobium sp.]|nr:hypothetical protein [Methylomicrobium sp.]
MDPITPTKPFTALFKDGYSNAFLFLLVFIDITFFFIHFTNTLTAELTGTAKKPLLLMDADKSYAEIYQYIKFFWVSVLFIYLGYLKQTFHYLAWSILFIYFLLDDTLQFHEGIGRQIVPFLNFAPPFGLRLQDICELMVSATAGSFIFPFLFIAYVKGSESFKKTSRDIGILVLLLIFFAVFVDMAHSAIKLGRAVNFSLAFIEDGGEMIVVSLIAWYVFRLSVNEGNSEIYLYDVIRGSLRAA